MTLESLFSLVEDIQPATAKEQRQFEDRPFPLVLSPTVRVAKEDLLSFLRANKTALLAQMEEYGAVALRGFPLTTAEDFQAVLDCLGLEPLPYVGPSLCVTLAFQLTLAYNLIRRRSTQKRYSRQCCDHQRSAARRFFNAFSLIAFFPVD